MKYGPLPEFLDQNSDSNLVHLEELFFLTCSYNTRSSSTVWLGYWQHH